MNGPTLALIEKMCVDPMENHDSLWWEPVYICPVEEAARVVNEAGDHEPMGWPRILPGTKKLRYKELPFLQKPMVTE